LKEEQAAKEAAKMRARADKREASLDRLDREAAEKSRILADVRDPDSGSDVSGQPSLACNGRVSRERINGFDTAGGFNAFRGPFHFVKRYM